MLIPIYFGSPHERLDRNYVSALMIQVKNRKTKSSLLLSQRDYARYFPPTWIMPVLVLLIDLGVAKVEVMRRGSFSPKIIGFHISGIGEEIYQCLQQEAASPMSTISLSTSMKLLLDVAETAGDNIQDLVAQHNYRYNTFTWSERFHLSQHSPVEDLPPESTEEVVERNFKQGRC